jgi:ribonuclease HI
MVLEIFTDGGSSGNPGQAASACVFYCDSETLYEYASAIGIATNNFAEYTALLHALKHVKKLLSNNPHRFSNIHIYSDSELMVRQVAGIYKVKNDDIKAFIKEIKTIQEEIKIPITYTHIPREKNKVADALVRSILYTK